MHEFRLTDKTLKRRWKNSKLLVAKKSLRRKCHEPQPKKGLS